MAINLGDIQIGKKYEFPAFKEVVGVFTATQNSKILKDGGDVKVYKDPDHNQMFKSDGENPEICFSGFGNGGQHTFDIEKGKKYYFWSGKYGCMNSRYLLLTSLDKIEIISISPPDGSFFSPAGYGSSDITFNQPVQFESSSILLSSKNIPVSLKAQQSSIHAEIKNEIWSLYKDGTITREGQPFTLMINGIKNNANDLYNGDGVLTIQYKTTMKPISVTNVKLPPIFTSIFKDDDPNSVFSITFDGPLSTQSPSASLSYGVAETGDYYQEKLITKIEGNSIIINFAGKSRKPKDMLRSGRVYSYISIQIHHVKDANGNTAWSDDPGSDGGYTFNIPYQE